jgi:uncharacterized protein
MKTKYILKVIYLLVVIQLLRVALKNICFLFIVPTTLANNSFNALFMIFTTLFILRVMKNYGYNKSLKIKDYKSYLIISAIIVLIGGLSLLIKKSFAFEGIINLLYYIIVIPIFEEILFRGYLWDRALRIYKNETNTLIVTTLLFALWNIGYVDTYLIQSILTNSSFTFSLILWKVLISLGVGGLAGIIRIKMKNCYGSMLTHSLLNIFIR